MRKLAWTLLGVLLACGVLFWRWLEETPYRSLASLPTPATDEPAAPEGAHAAMLPPAATSVPPAAVPDAAPPKALVRDAGPPWPATQIPKIVPSLEKTENVLLIGLDRQTGVIRGGRTDTLIVAAFDDESGHLALIGIPRDLWVEIPEQEPNRINAVYGLARRAKQDPLAMLERVIRDTLGIPIAHSVAIDLGVFEHIIDEVGGVVVDVQCPIVDDFRDPRLDGGRRVLRLDAGPQLIDGAKAAMFIRSRHGRSDWSRARRQQLVLRGLHRKLANIEGLARAPKLFASVERSVVSDMSRLQMLGLIRRVLRQDASKVHGVVLGHRETNAHRTEKNWAVLLPEPEAIAQRLATVFEAGAPGARPPLATCEEPEAALRKNRKRLKNQKPVPSH